MLQVTLPQVRAYFMVFVCRSHGCPCGHYTDPRRHCRCTPRQIARYRRRISGPLLDGITSGPSWPIVILPPSCRQFGAGARLSNHYLDVHVTLQPACAGGLAARKHPCTLFLPATVAASENPPIEGHWRHWRAFWHPFDAHRELTRVLPDGPTPRPRGLARRCTQAAGACRALEATAQSRRRARPAFPSKAGDAGPERSGGHKMKGPGGNSPCAAFGPHGRSSFTHINSTCDQWPVTGVTHLITRLNRSQPHAVAGARGGRVPHRGSRGRAVGAR